MPGPKNSAEERTIIAPLRRPAPKVQPDRAAGRRTPPRHGTRPPSKSLLPVVIFAGLALVLLVTGLGVATIYVLQVRDDAAVTEESLKEELVAVDQLPVTVPEEPSIIDLSGNPVVVPARQRGPENLDEIALGDPALASAVGTAGPVYRMSEDLLSPEVQLVSNLAASQQNFAFFQPDASRQDGGAVASGGGDVDMAPEAEGPAEQELLPYQDEAVSQDRESNIYYIDSSGAGSRREVVLRYSAGDPSDVIAGQGWSAEHAERLEAALAGIFGIEALVPEHVIALTGYRSAGDPEVYVPGRLVLYNGDDYAATLALTDLGDYVAGENPWFGEQPFEEPADPGVASGSFGLLEAIYGAAVRNNVPAPIVGEAILILSRAYDLSQSAKAGDRITLLYTPEARDPASGFGKVLYIGIAREADAIECYVFQPQGKSFTCVSSDGYAKDPGQGMVTPVSGVISAKFGPRKDPATGKAAMHPGVTWAAPAGTAVMAAFAGEVVSAGQHPDYGNYVKIAHSDGRETGYGHLQRIADHIATGVQVEAGGLIGYVGKTGRASEPQLFFQLFRNGQPTDPFGTFQRAIESGGAVDALVQRIIYVESAGNPTAKNPRSTATGLGQFIDSTWLRMIREHRPDLMQGRSREQVLALRTDPDIATEMVVALARGNASYLRSRGAPVTPGNLYLSHFLGPDGAVTALSATPETPLAELFPGAVIKANPFLTGKTARYVVEWAARKMKQKTPAIVEREPPRLEFAGDKRFVAMKQALDTMLN